MIPLLLFLVLPLLLPPNYASAQPPTSPSDRTTLLLLRSSLGVRSRDWPLRSDPCSSWLGLTCTNTTAPARRVVALDLSPLRRTRRARSDPRFAIDPVRNLTRLASLTSTGFPLPGPIPAWLGSTSLSLLALRSSNITGPIPPELALLRRTLKTLILADNSLSGPIPEEILALQLDSLDVSSNNLTGTLPESMPTNASHNATAASVLNLSRNAYFGPVPAYFLRFGAVDLSDNYFQGDVNASAAGLGLNCFRNVPGQRSPADCEGFYRGKGLVYDPPPQESSARKEKSRTWRYILAGALGAIGLVVAVVVLFVLCSTRAGARTADRGSAPVGIGAVSSGTAPPPSRAVSKKSPAIGEAFTYEQLVRATSSFSGTNLIKKGHSGDLYHGVLEGGFSVVVKRIDLTATKGEGYVAELDLFTRALHTRMVPFLGQCSENENEIFLVYKNMVHGDLSGALYKKSKQNEEGLISLDWITRLKIAIGVAEALCVLHHECNPPLVHRDVQASSILLDNKFEVRLGSLSEVCVQEGDEHHNVFTRFLRRSKKPEESASGLLPATCTYDVYCLGKVLLELVTGKLGVSEPNSSASTNEWLDHTLASISIYEKESVAKIIDPSLILDEDLLEEAWAMAIMAKSCLNPKPSKRPLARHVLKALENPLKVVRVDSRMNTARLMTTSSRGSWHSALFGSWRHSSSDIVPTSGPLREDRSLRRSSTRRSHESLGDPSSSHKRASRDVFPEPLGGAGDIEG
ncbi:putative LRR receptor-like serine/threonine-protein kinase [Iris pallida]|uniref:LRR receptor-like serine/threonine-protein kinase n=1 Tax=Iris pallida TaxID=29817 RepID=A0AAX6I238_IRIPA|nr:putative LRR receptor-like serine/threonine-protein kinase [Iris pallida]